MARSTRAAAIAPEPKAQKAAGTLGRPKKQDQLGRVVHDALLEAADECLLAGSSRHVPVRNIASRAGVNPAMVNYYFSSKDGLFLALFETQIAALIRDLKAFLREISGPAPAADGGREYVGELVGLIERNFLNSPAMFVMFHQDILDEENGTMTAYRERLGARGYQLITRIMETLMQRGLCRSDIAPVHAAYMICSISAMPFMVSPIFEQAFNSKIDGQLADQRRRAVEQLFSPLPQTAVRAA